MSNIIIPSGYSVFDHTRKNKHNKAKGNSGGTLILYKQHLRSCLKVKNKESQNILSVIYIIYIQ